MAINEKVLDLTALFDIKNLPESRTIISATGSALVPVSPYFASDVLDISARNLEEGDIPPRKTTKGYDCYIIYFEPKGTAPQDWSQTQVALIEDRGLSGLHMAFIELTSNTGHQPNTHSLTENTYTSTAVISPASKTLQELLRRTHGRGFQEDGFISLSRSQVYRGELFQTINRCIGRIHLTLPQELASDSKLYAGEFSPARQGTEWLDKITAEASTNAQTQRAEQATTLILERVLASRPGLD